MKNFWVISDSPTRKTSATCGGKEVSVDVRAKVKGESLTVVDIRCQTMPDGKLRVTVRSPLTNERFVVEDIET